MTDKKTLFFWNLKGEEKYEIINGYVSFHVLLCIVCRWSKWFERFSKVSQDHRELAIDCLIEVKTNKANGWEGEACEKYKKFSTTGLQAFKVEAEIATSAFKAYSKSNGATKNRVKRGLKQLVLIQENAESIRNVTGKIKAELQK